ncbi:MAG: DNA-directed RNA polymerase subunit beta [Candidatus Spechtbacteria bacterium SB0662_bin_43]|uniref:DNA-directed RNA polymerase subunit beta n=1 Tax=Candidatus Spechtbacteria bacterium SB0662_bin_43 TaxID=2604897 RepID=A0A845DAS7_9BACT|nr:DNA-directed RNA polymerase subunit beta [Candidatus Spechtbacteria bacterium SB0662_bin_43]
MTTIKTKVFSRYSHKETEIPNLLEIQRASYEWFLASGLRSLLDEVSPITDFSGKELEVSFGDYKFEEPKYNEVEARRQNASYESALRVTAQLLVKKTGEIKEQEIYLGTFPIMTERGTFIINGVGRVMISQLIRSSGVFFTDVMSRGKHLFCAKIIPNRGAWLEFETEYTDVIYVKIDRKRKVAATTLLRAFGMSTADIKKAFQKVDTGSVQYIAETLKQDAAKNQVEAFIEIYKRIRPGDLATPENAQSLVENTFFNFDRYDLSNVGRWKTDQRLGELFEITGDTPKEAKDGFSYTKEERVLHKNDVIRIIAEIIRMNNDHDAVPDDIDHLGNRRVRSVGETLQNRLRLGLTRMERIAKDKMSTLDIDSITPSQIINIRPVASVVNEFFASSQLSQFMDNTNPLAELEHKRILSATGPGGLTRDRAGFEVRDVQPSHYGRICPIQTPEGPNIGLVGRLSIFARINGFGFLETPYYVVKNGKITNEIHYLNALQEERAYIAAGTTDITIKDGVILDKEVSCRFRGTPTQIPTKKIQYIDVSPKQFISVATALVPFIEHDDAKRALMASNMQRQAVPCIRPEDPFVGTGLEERVARDSGLLVIAESNGKVVSSDAKHIKVRYNATKKQASHTKQYDLNNFVRGNQYTVIHQSAKVNAGAVVKKGDILADTSSVKDGFLSLGKNLLVAFMSWRGCNFEDAIVLNERLVKDDVLSSVYIEDQSTDVRETKLGPEITTPDIPNVGEDKLRNLDEEGIVRIGADVGPGDILVGKISPKGEADLTSEERLLRAIFGEKARDVKDTSLRMPHGKRGRVVGITVFSRDNGEKLPTGVIKKIQVEIAELRKIEAGDKLAGRHGNKGVISRVLPEEEMPFAPDGTPVDIILNPLGVPSRMNIGQILEVHLGWAAGTLGYRAITPAFSGATEADIKSELVRAGLPEDGKITLRDGQTGEPFHQPVTVGYMYIMKLVHMVEDKIHMRSIGPYSLITQQPLGGKAQFGGQRFGEMEVWALEGYGAAHNLQEILTIKSDDVLGRSSAYESIIKGEEIKKPNIPESFNVLVNEIKGLGLNVEIEETKED